MPYSHAALPIESLGSSVAALIGPEAKAGARRMVAQGLAPLAPRDFALALYQLWVRDLDGLGSTAASTLASLPEKVLESMLDDRELPGAVIDLIARRCSAREAIVGRILDHGNTDDTTFSLLAGVGSESTCERIAANQARWLRFPEIIASLYGNRKCRQSVIHRVLEFAMRAGVSVPIAMADEIQKALGESSVDPERDELLSQALKDDHDDERRRQAVAELKADVDEIDLLAPVSHSEHVEPATPAANDAPVDLQEEAEIKRARHAELKMMSPMEKIRAALLGSATDRSVLVRDTNKTVAMAAIKCPRVRDSEVVGYSSDRSLTNDVIRYIASRRDWVKLYAVKFNLVMNPKTPMPKALAFLATLSRKDLTKVARSKNIPSALQKAAKRKADGAA